MMDKSTAEIMDTEFKDIEFTEEMRDDFKSGKVQIESSDDDGFSGTDMRMNMGNFYTDKEWKKKRERILK